MANQQKLKEFKKIMKIFNLFSVLFGILGGVMGYLFGGFDILIITLLCMTALDYVTGVT